MSPRLCLDEIMKFTSVLVGLVCLAVFGTTQADESWHNRNVLTSEGLVRFVPDSISPEALAGILFPNENAPLTRSIWKTPAVSETQSNVSVAMLIQFEFGSSKLTTESMRRLDLIGEMLKLELTADKRLVIEGHTDVAGSDSYNDGLSLARAESVKMHLAFNHQIELNRLDIVGKGEKQLIDPENPLGAINRRVQFKAS